MSPVGRKPVTAETRRKRGESDRPMPVVIGGRSAPRMPADFDSRMQTCWRILVVDLTRGDAIDRADGAVMEAFVVNWARARQARAAMKGQPLLILTPQGQVPNRLLDIERAAWKEVRAMAESMPLSHWGRARLGLKGAAPNEPVGQTIGPSPRRLRAVGNDG